MLERFASWGVLLFLVSSLLGGAELRPAILHTRCPAFPIPPRSLRSGLCGIEDRQHIHSLLEQKDKSLTCSKAQCPYSVKSPVIILCIHEACYISMALCSSLYHSIFTPNLWGGYCYSHLLNSFRPSFMECLVCFMYSSRHHRLKHYFVIIPSQEGDFISLILKKLKLRDTK